MTGTAEPPREIMGSTSAVPGDRVVCLYDKPTRKMICRTFDQWRAIGVQRAAKRNWDKSEKR
ncbi:hypothetical protein [Sphingomonas sp. ERG5]|uniref:hypothetical protein n=1 Tax=Sphingomonas sp. ERG5 TaxID=1381597 RepID=UPI00054BF925|nr:hypothetical protein [Sphingomonas sp. ERG5]